MIVIDSGDDADADDGDGDGGGVDWSCRGGESGERRVCCDLNGSLYKLLSPSFHSLSYYVTSVCVCVCVVV